MAADQLLLEYPGHVDTVSARDIPRPQWGVLIRDPMLDFIRNIHARIERKSCGGLAERQNAGHDPPCAC